MSLDEALYLHLKKIRGISLLRKKIITCKKSGVGKIVVSSNCNKILKIASSYKGVETFKTYVKTWYTGELQDIFFVREENKETKKQICSVLAGYVWDTNNQFVRNHKRAVSSLAKFIRSTYEDSNTAV